MPRNQTTWSAWNFLGRSNERDTSSVCVTYWLNRLQHLPAHAPQMFVTLNPLHGPDPSKVIRRLNLSHPMYSFGAVKAQQRLGEIQGADSIYFAGAWCGYGFHEDGIKVRCGCPDRKLCSCMDLQMLLCCCSV